jgi:hypothetical protein
VSGTPFASGLIAADLAGGPTPTSIGPICLGLSPALQTSPFALDVVGTFAAGGVVPFDPALGGVDVFLQAAAAQGAGFAMSNGVRLGLRRPRVFVIFPGFTDGFSSIPGSWSVLDVMTGSFGPIHPLPSWVRDVVAVPAIGGIAFLLGSGALRVYDGETGAPITDVTPASPTILLMAPPRLLVEGTTLLLAEIFSPSWATLRTFDLPAGNLRATVALSSTTDDVLIVPGSGFAYAVDSLGPVVPIALATGALHAPISSASGRWIVGGTNLYGVVALPGGGHGLDGIDPSTNAKFFPAPVPIPFPLPTPSLVDDLFRFGPGSLGPSLFLRDAASGTLVQFSPQSFTPSAPPIPIAPGTSEMGHTNGGSEWILLENPPCALTWSCGGFPQTVVVHVMNPVTHAIATVGSFQSGYSNEVLRLPSNAINKAFLAGHGNPPTLTMLDTDPLTVLPPPLLLPLQYVQMRYVVD